MILLNMKIHKIEQGSKEWFDLKNKYPLSASKAAAIATAGKGMETVVREALAERYSSADPERYTNEDLERGVELEADARTIYELENDVTVVEVGFVTDSKISSLAGVSPDGLVGKEGLSEIKCLKDTTYLDKLIEVGTAKTFKVPSAHDWQMQMQLLFTGRKWVDYVLYNPNYKIPLLIKRVEVDPVKQQKLLTGLKLAESHYKRHDELVKKVLKITK